MLCLLNKKKRSRGGALLRRTADGGCPHTSLIALHVSMCNNLHMATNLALDDKLIEEARRAGKHKTKKSAVTAALAEYIQRRKQLRILEAFGNFEFDPAYDCKAERRRQRP
jgi:Arc/MetJ family transcription regulator